MGIIIILSNTNGPNWAEPGFQSLAHIKLKGSLSNLAYICLSSAQPLSGPLTPLLPTHELYHQKL